MTVRVFATSHFHNKMPSYGFDFQASDPMKTYTLILKGIRGLDIPNKRVSKTAASLVKKLCRENPSDRIGSGSGGIADIRKHK